MFCALSLLLSPYSMGVGIGKEPRGKRLRLAAEYYIARQIFNDSEVENLTTKAIEHIFTFLPINNFNRANEAIAFYEGVYSNYKKAIDIQNLSVGTIPAPLQVHYHQALAMRANPRLHLFFPRGKRPSRVINAFGSVNTINICHQPTPPEQLVQSTAYLIRNAAMSTPALWYLGIWIAMSEEQHNSIVSSAGVDPTSTAIFFVLNTDNLRNLSAINPAPAPYRNFFITKRGQSHFFVPNIWNRGIQGHEILGENIQFFKLNGVNQALLQAMADDGYPYGARAPKLPKIKERQLFLDFVTKFLAPTIIPGVFP